MHKTAEFLRSCGAFYLAAVEGGQPRVRPFGALDEFEGKLYFRRAGSLELLIDQHSAHGAPQGAPSFL